MPTPRILNIANRSMNEFLDGVAITALLGVLADLLTVWASAWTVIWLSIRIYESKTFQRWWYGEDDAGDDKPE